MTPQDLLDHFGTQKKIADFFGCSTSTVNEWFQRGEVPSGRQFEAQVKTAGLLVACSCRSAVPREPTFCEGQ
jgi:hypothetical protein